MPAALAASRFKLSGVCPPARAAVLAELTRLHPAPVWIVVAADLKAAEQLAEDMAFFHEATDKARAQTTLVFPESMPDTRDMREAFAASNDRFTVLSKLRASRNTPHISDSLVVVTTPAALVQPVPALEEFATREFTLTKGDRHSTTIRKQSAKRPAITLFEAESSTSIP
jgi:transcription-repair coupling factor (superfamily II helicase)